LKRAERAEKVRETGFLASSSKASFSSTYKTASFSGVGNLTAATVAMSMEDGDEVI
jgi:hypothetical protein